MISSRNTLVCYHQEISAQECTCVHIFSLSLCLSLIWIYKYCGAKGSIYVNHPRIFHNKREAGIAMLAARARSQKQNKTKNHRERERETDRERGSDSHRSNCCGIGESSEKRNFWKESRKWRQLSGTKKEKKVNLQLSGVIKTYRKKTRGKLILVEEKDKENT